MTFLFSVVLWNTLIASVLAVVVGLFGQTPWLRRRPAVMHILWGLVLVKFVTPAFIPVPLLPARATLPVTVESEPNTEFAQIPRPAESPNYPAVDPTEPTIAPRPSDLTASLPGVSFEPLGDVTPVQDAIPADQSARIATFTSALSFWGIGCWEIWLAVISLCGSTGIVLYNIFCVMWFRGWLKVSASRNERLFRLLENCRVQMRATYVPAVRALHVRCSPFLWSGGLPSCIYVPQTMLDDFDDESLTGVLCHELAHHMRRDTWANLFASGVTAIVWWNPLAWWSHRMLRKVQELCCDALVLSKLGLSRQAYAETLFTSLEIVNNTPPIQNLLASGWGDVSSLKARFQMIGDSTVVPRAPRGFVFTAMLLAAILLCVPVRAQSKAEPKMTEAREQVAIPQPDDAIKPGTKTIDVKEFQLILTYHGSADKPYYDLNLHVAPTVAQQAVPFFLAHQISEEQAVKIVHYLSESRFFKEAQSAETQNDPQTGPQYLLRVKNGDRNYQESLGWDIGTAIRLDLLRKTLDGDAAKSMDLLLGRLTGHRKIWETGQVSGGLKSTLSADDRSFDSGHPIPIKLELTNVGDQDRSYGHHHFILSGSEIVIVDEYGRNVPYLAGGAGLLESRVNIKSAETKVLEACDLSKYYYLRRPGRCSVTFLGRYLPPSNSLSFEVTADPAGTTDGDPMGRLLSLTSSHWNVIGSPNPVEKVQPGSNHRETPGWQFIFVGPLGLKASKEVVWLWLTDQPVDEIEPPAGHYLPKSDYLGKVSRWNVYLYASPEALVTWPAAVAEIKLALASEKPRQE